MIPIDAVRQEDGHVGDVEVGQGSAEATGHAHRQGEQQITQVVEVAGEAPEAGGEQEGLVLLAVGAAVGGADEGGGAAPDAALALGAAEAILLVVGKAEDQIAYDAQCGSEEELQVWQANRRPHQVLCLQGVHEG